MKISLFIAIIIIFVTCSCKRNTSIGSRKNIINFEIKDLSSNEVVTNETVINMMDSDRVVMNSTELSEVDSSGSIFDPITPANYEFTYESNVILPDSLGGKAYRGLAVMKGIINDSLKVVDIKMINIRLYTQEKDSTVFDYFSYEGIFPPEISVYIPFFRKQIEETVHVKKIRNSTYHIPQNEATFILRINKLKEKNH